MPPLHREHNVHGPFTLEGGALLAQEAQRAKDAGRDFTVCLMSADPIRDFTGRVESVELIEGEKPTAWRIVMAERALKVSPRKR